MIRGIIFDLDGVIADTAKFHYIAWKEIGKKYDLEVDEEFNENLKGVSRDESLRRILEFNKAEEKFSAEEKEKIATEKNELYKNLLNTLTEKDILAGIEKFLKDIKARDMKIALASASKNASLILEKLNLLDMIDYIADPAEVKNGKPAPDIFIKACEGIGLKIDEVIGVEDSYSGVSAMKKCAMKSIGIGVDADYILKSTADLDLEKVLDFFKREV